MDNNTDKETLEALEKSYNLSTKILTNLRRGKTLTEQALKEIEEAIDEYSKAVIDLHFKITELKHKTNNN